jgi:hypothetical protein
LGAFDGNGRRAVAGCRIACDDQIVGMPSGVARLPVDTGHSPEIDAKGIRSAEEIDKEFPDDFVKIAWAQWLGM